MRKKKTTMTRTAARVMARQRWDNATEEDRDLSRENGKLGGRPKILIICEGCGKVDGTAVMRRHNCEKKKKLVRQRDRPLVKVTAQMRERICEGAKKGLNHKQLAKKYKMSESTVRDVLRAQELARRTGIAESRVIELQKFL